VTSFSPQADQHGQQEVLLFTTPLQHIRYARRMQLREAMQAQKRSCSHFI